MSLTPKHGSTLVSNKGKRLLVKDGFVYKMNKQTASKIYWLCKTKNCKAHIHTDLNHIFLLTSGEHNHLLEPGDQEVQEFRAALKQRAINETTPIPKIYDEEIAKAQFPTEVLAKVPLIRDIRNVIVFLTRLRKFTVILLILEAGLNQARRKLTPVLPDSSMFDVPESYQTTSTGEQFLFCDTSVSRRKRMLLFGSPKQLQLLFDSPTLMMDGTFLATPPFFHQVFTIHALKFDTGTTHIIVRTFIWTSCSIFRLPMCVWCFTRPKEIHLPAAFSGIEEHCKINQSNLAARTNYQ